MHGNNTNGYSVPEDIHKMRQLEARARLEYSAGLENGSACESRTYWAAQLPHPEWNTLAYRNGFNHGVRMQQELQA